MRKVSFPCMGTSYIPFEKLLKAFGNDVIVPPRPTEETISYGTKYAPEFACYPFKIVLGTYVQVLEKGANTLVSSGGVGPCRAGLYTTLHEKILKDLGYEFEMITLEPPGRHLKDLIESIKKLINVKLSIKDYATIGRFVWKELVLLDKIEKLSHKVRPLEVKKGETTQTYKKCVDMIAKAEKYSELVEIEHESERLFDLIEKKDYDPIKIGIVGEIYVLLEPASNLEIEEMLGDLGVYVERSMFLSGYTISNAVLDLFHIKGDRDAKKMAAPYFKEMCGGHGRESVGNSVIFAKRGFDGVIQLSPFTCIPEIVAKSILPKVCKEHGLGFLSINFDEQTGKEGLRTRLEAFVDLLEAKRERLEYVPTKSKIAKEVS
ncbi:MULTISPECIES: 2-hydroxyacyl-CoA dehydratase [Tepidanaerobacter]|uniref:Nucleotide-binding protein, sugar kinase/HSP70/actin superfamily n=1 Tax=Tepidanaerobacter syntrophicus TaxID=224999 RepID=A0A0U9HQT6_9FIRM|nr:MULTISPECIES: 2-hydroxyacyl-CoA dehydratase [Tepidanaerobacter]GAQ25399.1 nucleotide-binding protein, sugar kinase/HSP70/actin superfamily [Tepidanaerobacter syntrophicus]